MTPNPGNLHEAMLQAVDTIHQFAEAAKGLQAKMEADGWSPTAAEMAATEMLRGLIHMAMKG